MPAPSPVDVLAERLRTARAQTDELFALLTPAAVYSRPVAERHRLIFYVGHLEAFDWNQVCRQSLGIASFHPEFDKLFEFGIDPPVGQATQDQPADWPSIEAVQVYNRRVRASLDDVIGQASPQIVNVALEHRLMHAETLAYLIHNLPYEQKRATPRSIRRSNAPLAHRMVEIPAGRATLGQRAGQFGWDNEFKEHRIQVPAFAISRYKVTNGEYLEFVKSGAAAPHFWRRDGGKWLLHGMFGEEPLPLNAPVWVTHAEASAYAQWAGKKLPTETQFHRAAYGTPEGAERAYPWGDAPPDQSRGNFDFAEWDATDVDSSPCGDSAFGVSQLVGNGWDWTATEFGPFPGFEPFSFYPGYSRNFFDEEHYVMKGASPRTAACFLRRSFRNWFRPNYPYVYAGFHLVER